MNELSRPVNPNLPVSLHPDNFKSDGTNRGEFVAGQITHIYDRLERLDKVVRTHRKDKNLDPVQLAKQLRAARSKTAEEASKSLAALIDESNSSVREARGKLNLALAPVNKGSNGAKSEEIRSYLRTLPDQASRSSHLREAARAGDLATVSAVLSAPGYLSGFKHKEGFESLCTELEGIAAPAEAAEFRNANEFAHRMMSVSAALKEHLAGDKDMSPAEVRARAAEEALAEALEG